MTLETDMDLFLWACKGDRDAAMVLKMLTDAADVWDNMVDGDQDVPMLDARTSFHNILVDLPANPFYRAHREAIEAIVAVGAANWKAATGIERMYESGVTDKLHVAYIIRSSYFDLVTYCAHVLGGPAWAEKVALKARAMNHAETFSNFVGSLDTEIAARRANGGN